MGKIKSIVLEENGKTEKVNLDKTNILLCLLDNNNSQIILQPSHKEKFITTDDRVVKTLLRFIRDLITGDNDTATSINIMFSYVKEVLTEKETGELQRKEKEGE
jgi:hypothetical protein